MHSKWQVTHKIADPIDVAPTRPSSIPDMGITFEYAADGKLTDVIKDVYQPDAGSSSDAIAEADKELRGVWEWLSFIHRFPVVISHRMAMPLGGGHEEDDALAMTGHVSSKMDALLAWQVDLSQLASLQESLKHEERLTAWLRLANDARDMSNAAAALRHYYLILEDLSTTKISKGHPWYDIKRIRHFVSHNRTTEKYRTVLDLVEEHVGRRDTQYNPHDSKHYEMIYYYCQKARVIVEAELNKIISADGCPP